MKVRKFKSGAIRDSEEGKPDFVETQNMIVEWRFAQYMTSKKAKYGEGNFKKGMDKESALRSAYRHLVKLIALEDCKKYGWPTQEWMEPNEDHASAARFNLNVYMQEDEVAKK